MNKLHSVALVAIMTAALGLSAIAPATAQQSNPNPPAGQTAGNDHGQRPFHRDRNGPGRDGGGLGGLLRFEGGAEAIEIGFIRVSHAVDLTAEQTGLLEALKTSALSAQAEFASVLEASRPAPDATTKPELSEMVAMRITMETAHAKALSAVLPSLDAFMDSLSVEQKAQLAELRGGPMGKHDGNGPNHHHGRNNQPGNGNGDDAPQPPANG